MVTKGNVALMYHAPGKRREFNAFVLDKSYYGPYDETSCIDWTDDSRSALLLRASLLWDAFNVFVVWASGVLRWAVRTCPRGCLAPSAGPT